MEFVGGGAGGSRVAGGEHDFDARAENASVRHRVFGLSDHSSNHRVGDADPALSESEQCKARLRVATELVGALIGGFGAIEVADEPEEIAFDHACAREGGGVDGSGQTFAGASGFDERLGPSAAQLQHLGSVQEAVAAIEHELLLACRTSG